MRKITMMLVLTLAGGALFAQEVKANGAKGSYEQIPMKVLEVVEIAEDGFVFTGYFVDYKGKKIMVSSMMGGEASKVGDEISVMVQKMEIPGAGKITKSFMFMVMPDMSKMTRDFDLKQKKEAKDPDDAKSTDAPVETKDPKKEF